MNSIDKAVDFLRLLKVRNIGNINYQNIAIIGLFSGWIVYNSLERNWIPINLIIGIVLISAIGTSIIFFKFYKTKLGLVWSIFHNLTIGLLVVFLFVKSNNFLSSEPIVTKEYYITNLLLEHGTNGKRSSSGLKPKITVEINGMSKNFTLHTSRSKSATHTRKVIIGIKKGFWNYNIVKSLKLANEE
ncbi:hypothetical protein PXD56_04345 [Maribacter sp. SA7]|uniref:hypothetical protein n=1 Tax=Maribacter zhoushanensis TaxID=3030012 RepID=UPI0023EAA358|nr:hypothetical protein [Maribacter zhoushanensis]MDF4202168.1 hypothetical protein [Maribacter zhoushanensis]